MRTIVLVAHNLRSCHNIGSLLRTAEGLGISQVILSGYSPYPEMDNDTRLPYIRQKLQHQIHKTALGAELSGIWRHVATFEEGISSLRLEGFTIAALEQTASAKDLPTYAPPEKIAIV